MTSSSLPTHRRSPTSRRSLQNCNVRLINLSLINPLPPLPLILLLCILLDLTPCSTLLGLPLLVILLPLTLTRFVITSMLVYDALLKLKSKMRSRLWSSSQKIILRVSRTRHLQNAWLICLKAALPKSKVQPGSVAIKSTCVLPWTNPSLRTSAVHFGETLFKCRIPLPRAGGRITRSYQSHESRYSRRPRPHDRTWSHSRSCHLRQFHG